MTVSINPIKNALVSVSDKRGLLALCQALSERGVAIYGTSGTGEYLKKDGKIAAHSVESLTQFPEMMDGRVKTLHPKVFGGVLARRENPKDVEEAKRFEIPLFDLVIVNLYPFWEHRGEAPEKQSSFIDIGGPSLIRAASKNYRSVVVLSDPEDYSLFLEEWKKENGGTSMAFRHQMAQRTFQRTSEYDAMIAAEWAQSEALPKSLSLSNATPLRYGENPHQKAAWAKSDKTDWKILQGKELSYNNLLDAEAALRIVMEFTTPAVSIVKHNNPCGVAAGSGLSYSQLFSQALSTDSKSAFGGIVAVNGTVDEAAANEMSPIFLEVVVAKGFTSGAQEVFAKKKNLRLIAWESPAALPVEVRSALGGWLVQEADNHGIPESLKEVTTTKVSEGTWNDLRFAWLVTKHVRSNAIVIAKSGVTLGIGAGQMSRVDAVNIAIQKCPEGSLKGSVLASDAFFPFRDNIDLLKGLGIAAIIQPGGSQRDPEVIAACNELGIAMVFTGERHFRH